MRTDEQIDADLEVIRAWLGDDPRDQTEYCDQSAVRLASDVVDLLRARVAAEARAEQAEVRANEATEAAGYGAVHWYRRFYDVCDEAEILEAKVARVQALCDEQAAYCSCERVDPPTWVASVRAALAVPADNDRSGR